MNEPSSLGDLTAALAEDTRAKTIEPVKAEIQRSNDIGSYLGAIEQILAAEDIDGNELKFWIDSSALVLGKNLAEEKLQGDEKKVTEAINEIIDVEVELAKNTADLQKVADLKKTTVEALLADTSNPTVNKVRELRESKAKRIAALKPLLRTYGLSLVQTLQQNVETKKSLSEEELAALSEKFKTLDAPPQDYNSYVARLRAEFVDGKKESGRIVSKEEMESSNAVREFAWNRFLTIW